MNYDLVILTDHRYENPKETNWYVDQVVLEDKLVQQALEAKGLNVIRKSWDAKNFDWSSCSHALFRTTWDYFDRFDEFFSWFKSTQKKLKFINAPDIIYWNLDKHYLKDLQQKGIHIPHTVFIEKGSVNKLQELLNANNWEKAVLKPAIAGAARETYLISPSNCTSHEEQFQKLIANEAMLLQEFQHNIVNKGEISLVMIGGKYTHAVLKKAKAGDFRVQDDFGGTVEVYQAKAEEIAFAEKAISACPSTALYGRVDLFYDNQNKLALGELELIEPELWFRNYNKAADLLAEEVKHALTKSQV